jgi:coenzyme F420-0:L-glutamate ligase/coenzyme F420-1:gamma-L-glutamate ligase
MNTATTLILYPVLDAPLIHPGDDLASVLIDALEANGPSPEEGDVLVVAQKVVSKAENRYVNLRDVTPSQEAIRLAGVTGKDARFVQVVLAQSEAVVRAARNVLIVRHRNGLVYANAGVDQSNIAQHEGQEAALLLPEDCDASAARIRKAFRDRLSISIAVIINDSSGRPWRLGVTGIALGCAGIKALDSRIGEPDLFGAPLRITEVAVADELASAASHVMGQGNEGIPAVLIRGARVTCEDGRGACQLLRPPEQDLFR